MRTPPVATYRLQFHAGFRFADAAALVPYLHELGVSHLYASPFFHARPGSGHGYDVVDHNALNPELGEPADLDDLVETLHRHGMGQVVDFVPNHMGIGGRQNAWWLDVLEHGEASAYAEFFDIDWHPVSAALQNRVLLPLLGGHYGDVLEKGELELRFDAGEGRFEIAYWEHRFPLDPRTYPMILTDDGRLSTAPLHPGDAAALAAVVEACRALPRRTETPRRRREQRREAGLACRRRLASLYHAVPAVQAHVAGQVAIHNGTPGVPASYDRLHRLLEAQAYRLAYWLVAADEINYRRFFDINDLAGLRMENPEVFEASHRLVHELLASGRADGLRIDHPDGLSDPYRYYRDLRALMRHASRGRREDAGGTGYLVIEKILAAYERLPLDWPVAGTTGYETARLLNGLFVQPAGEAPLGRTYERFVAERRDFDELLYRQRQLIMRTSLASELTLLANLASRIAQHDRHTRDFTYHGLRTAIAEIAACFPVYRTYVAEGRVAEDDLKYLRWAVTQAKRRSRSPDVAIFEFLERLLALDGLPNLRGGMKRRVLQFALRFQQYTAPVMAKGMEDTALYLDNRLVSLNDVGFDPRAFGVSVAALHRENSHRLQHWPASMVATSTHDSKRSEDVRLRINVISEQPEAWRRHLYRWRRLNRDKRLSVGDRPAPSRNDEYLLYQTLLGTWPLETPDADALAAYRERMSEYMIKAVREAKRHSSWLNPDSEYENAVRQFVEALLDDPERNPFLVDFAPLARRFARSGLLGSLSQVALKLTIPGVPDIYQGNELWQFDLVDPDNRRPVDYGHRRELLKAMRERLGGGEDRAGIAREYLERLDDGRAKLYVTWTVLQLRRDDPQLFAEGEYLPLGVEGERQGHLVAFARRLAGRHVLVVAPRWFSGLLEGGADLPVGAGVWQGTRIEAPAGAAPRRYRNLLTNEAVRTEPGDGGPRLEAAALFTTFPVAVLVEG